MYRNIYKRQIPAGQTYFSGGRQGEQLILQVYWFFPLVSESNRNYVLKAIKMPTTGLGH